MGMRLGLGMRKGMRKGMGMELGLVSACGDAACGGPSVVGGRGGVSRKEDEVQLCSGIIHGHGLVRHVRTRDNCVGTRYPQSTSMYSKILSP
jgi:hypothetical protein